jgi:bifunctional enzyme CysN/CysC
MTTQTKQRQDMNIVIVGHVDHGKSTIIGRLLADTRSLPEGKLDQVKERCRRNSKPFEYAFLLDALKDEQSQGITIDAARCFFKTEKRNYIIIDAPGHIEFLKNMVTGASRAEAALLVIDAKEGVRENSRRHGYMLSMLGIQQIAVLVNKMDLVDYDQKVYDAIVAEYKDFLKKINIEPMCFIPVSGMEGDSVAELKDNMPWYTGQTALQALDTFTNEQLPSQKPFRMPAQAVYKFTKDGDNRRCVAGTIASGAVTPGDTVIFYPSGKKSKVKTLEVFNRAQPQTLSAGYASAFTLEEQIYVTRGELACIEGQLKPEITTRLKVNLFWLSRNPLEKNKEYWLKVGTAKVKVRLTEITSVIDASNLDNASKNRIERHDVAECVLTTDKVISFDKVEHFAHTSRFVIIDNYEISGGGIIQEGLADRQSRLREKVMLRNYKWESSVLTPATRAKKYNQKASLLLMTGEKAAGKKELAKIVEKRLFEDAKFVYFLGIGNVLYGVDADIKTQRHDPKKDRAEHLRRLGEVSHILLDCGVILIVTATQLSQADLEIIKTATNPDLIETIWVGEDKTTDIVTDLHITNTGDINAAANSVIDMLAAKGIIFKAW